MAETVLSRRINLPRNNRRGAWLTSQFFFSLGCATTGIGEGARGPGGPLTVVWPVDNVSRIGGYQAKRAGTPAITPDRQGACLCLDGKGDAVVLPVNPIAGQSAFSIEVLVKPAVRHTTSQTVLHLEDTMGDGRVLLELHGLDDGRWQARLSIRNKIDQVKLEAPTGFASDEWHWLGITFADGILRLFVDARQAGETRMSFIATGQGNTAVGTRLNFEGWFKGCVREIRFANDALPSARLAQPPGVGGPLAPASN